MIEKNQISAHTGRERIYGIDYLRALNILGTVLFHSWIAYSPTIQGLLTEELKQEIPLIDYSIQFMFADLIIIVRPIFSMQLMFLISGLFSWRSLDKKGAYLYIRDRVVRLMLPFAVGIFILLPITYYAGALLDSSQRIPLLSFWKSYLRDGPYHGVHFWFLWVLLCFDIVLAFTYIALKKFPFKAGTPRSSLRLIAATMCCGFLLYWMAVQVAGPSSWRHLAGPFYIQIDSLPIYLAYFLSGCLLGNIGLSKLIGAPGESRLKWAGALVMMSILDLLLIVKYLQGSLNIDYSFRTEWLTPFGWLPYGLLYISTGALTIAIAMISFAHLFSDKNNTLDNLQRNSYSIYVIHFTVVAWLQLGMSRINIASNTKPVLVFLLAVPISWLLADVMRRTTKTILTILRLNQVSPA